VAAVLISMFVSFTLDPMLSSIWHDPEIHAEGAPRERKTLYDRTIGRITGAGRGTRAAEDEHREHGRAAVEHAVTASTFPPRMP